jgi:hypothetical protein
MTELFLEQYFSNIATALKDISHTVDLPAFHRMKDSSDLDEFDNAVRNMQKDVCLLLEIGGGSIGEYDTQNDMPHIGLHILCKSTDLFAEVNAARDRAKTILLKIVSRMRLDCKGLHERMDNADGPLRAKNVTFDTRIKFSNMTAIDGNWYGKSFYFDFRVPLNLVYEPNDWT